MVQGKPPKPPKNTGIFMQKKRTKTIKIRLFDHEFEQLNQLKTEDQLAKWMRETCLAKKTKRRNPPVNVDPSLLRQLASIGNNLNQLARLANSKGMATLDSIEIISVLREIKAELEALRRQNASQIQ